jgi:hypothetical protein
MARLIAVASSVAAKFAGVELSQHIDYGQLMALAQI